jgi:hypothetical protein
MPSTPFFTTHFLPKSSLVCADGMILYHNTCVYDDFCGSGIPYQVCVCENGIPIGWCCSNDCTEIKTDTFSTIPMATIETTTILPISYTTPCPRGLLPDGNGGCYFEDTCEMIYGPCDCYGRSECCTYGECFIVCGPESNGSRNCRCSPPETIVPEPTTTAHNKCVKK